MKIQMTPGEIALMKRIKYAFDPKGLLNPEKIFPDEAANNAFGNGQGAMD